MQVILKSSDLQIPASVGAVEHTQSKHTGKVLRVLKIHFERPRPDKQSSIVGETKQIMVEDSKGTVVGQFKVGHTSYSYRDDGPSSQHSWELTEFETLNASSLVLAETLTVVPYRYAEEILSDDVLEVEASVKLTRDEARQLRALPRYFPVVRKGINDTAYEMRFGKLLWSEADDGIKMRIILMDRRYDKSERQRGLMEPQFSNLAIRVFQSREILKNLLSLLEQKGMLSEADRQKVTTIAEEQITAQDYELDRVKDIDSEPYLI